MWPFKAKAVPEKTPLRGLEFRGVKVDAPRVDASPEQWLDWAALIGGLVGNGLIEGADEWMAQIFRAYRERWSPDGKS